MPDCIWEKIKFPPINNQSKNAYYFNISKNTTAIEKLRKELT